MATQKLPFFMQAPERNQCVGRMLSLAHTLKAEGYKGRHIKFAALETAFQYAQEEPYEEYLNFLLYVQDMVRRDLVDLDERPSEFEREKRVEDYIESL